MKSAIFCAFLSGTLAVCTSCPRARTGSVTGDFTTRLGNPRPPSPVWGLSTRLCCSSFERGASPPGMVSREDTSVFRAALTEKCCPHLQSTLPEKSTLPSLHYLAEILFKLGMLCCTLWKTGENKFLSELRKCLSVVGGCLILKSSAGACAGCCILNNKKYSNKISRQII